MADDPTYIEYFRKNLAMPMIKIIDKQPKEMQRQTQPEHLELNNSFARPYFEENPHKLTANQQYAFPRIENPPITNELNPDQYEISKPGEIDIDKVSSYLSQQVSDNAGPIQNLNKVFCPILPKISTFPSMPSSYWREKSGMIELTIKDISSSNLKSTGFFQLYNISTEENIFTPITEPLYFANNLFTQGMVPVSYLHCPNSDIKTYLICYIYRQTPNGSFPLAVAANKLFYEKDGAVMANKGFTTFGHTFTIIGGSDLRSSITAAINPSQLSPSDLSEVRTELIVNFVKFNFCYYQHSWTGGTGTPICAIYIAPKYNFPTPVVSIYDIEFTLKNPPKSSFMFFKAYVINDLLKVGTTLPVGLPLLTIDKPNKETEFTSTNLPPANSMRYNENIRVYIDKNFNSQTHLVIILYALPIDKKEPAVYKIGFIPLSSCLQQASDRGIQRFILCDPKRIPKDYLRHPKLPNRTYLSCSVNLPPAYILPTNLEKFANAPPSDSLELPDFDKESFTPLLIPIVSKLLQNPSLDNFKRILEIFKAYDQRFLNDLFRPWAYNILSPKFLPQNFVNEFSTILSTLMEDSVKAYLQLKGGAVDVQQRRSFLTKTQPDSSVEITKAQGTITELMMGLPIFMDLLIVMISENKNFDLKNILLFFKVFSEFLSEGASICPYEDISTTAEAASNFLYLMFGNFEFKDVAEIMFDTLRAISALRDPPCSMKKEQILMTQFKFILRFANSPAFFLGLCTLTKQLPTNNMYSPYNKLLSQIFLCIFDLLKIDDTAGLKLCSTFISLLCTHIDTFPDEIALHVVYSFFPLIHIIFSDFESSIIKNNVSVQLQLVPFVLLLLNKSSTQRVTAFFAVSIQHQFITFLNAMVTVLLNAQPFNVHFFIQATQRIMQFLLTVVDLLGSSMPQVVELCDALLNDYQTPANYPIFFNFLKQTITKFQCERSLISMLLKRFTSSLLSTRCLSTALLSLQFQSDYTRNGSIVLSSIDTMDSLTAILLENEVDKIAVYNKFLDVIVDISEKNGNPDFSGKVRERMQAAHVIANVVEDQKRSTYPPEVRCQQVMKIANQYNMYPTMRLKWLQECLKINQTNNDPLSAFVSQLHVVALIATVYHHNKNSLVSNTDPQAKKEEDHFHLSIVQPIKYALSLYDSVDQSFEFMPEVVNETKIDFASMQAVALELLNDMTLNLLTEEIDRAINIGCEAGLFYSVRPLHSFQLRIHHRSRNFKECANACKQLAERFKSITTNNGTLTHDTPIATYLVVDAPKNERHVFFCQKDANNQRIVDILNAKERGSMNVKLCPKHALGCTHNGVCIVPLEIDDDRLADDEHTHCWQKFRSQVFISDYEGTDFGQKQVNVLYITTKNHIPHYRMSVEIENIEVTSYSVLELVRMGAENTIRACDVITKDLEMWFENEKNVDHEKTADQLFASEITKLIKILDVILKGKDCIYDRLKRLRTQKQEEAKEIANRIRESIARIMKVFARVAVGLPNMPTVNVHLNMYTVLVNDFCKDFGIPNVKPGQQFDSYKDPMSVVFDFEKKNII